jgi:hypothetical protein
MDEELQVFGTGNARPPMVPLGLAAHGGQRLVTRCRTVRALTPALQCLQEGFSLLEVGGVKAFGEPDVDRRQQLVCFGPLALLLPQAAQAGGRPQGERTGLLGLCDVEGLLEALICLAPISRPE